MEKAITAKEGMRVHVFSPDQNEDWGFGTIEKVGVLEFREDGGAGESEVLSSNYPKQDKTRQW